MENNYLTHVSAGALWIDCSHEVAVDYFIESIRTPCFLARYVCTNPYKALKVSDYALNRVVGKDKVFHL